VIAADEEPAPPGPSAGDPARTGIGRRGLARVLPPHRRRVLLQQTLLSLELVALAAFAFSRPVLDSFGRSPETFISRGVTGAGVVVFGVVVAVVPALVAAAVGVVARGLARGPVRPWVQPALVGVLGGVGAWRLGQDLTRWPSDTLLLQVAGVTAGALLAAARRHLPSTQTFLRLAGGVSVVFLGQFLFLSPASSLVFQAPGTLTDDDRAAVASQLGDDPPDVLFVLFDALPTTSLLDGSGQIDRERFPNFAALADEATWYRNHTTVAGYTLEAVPALLTGRHPHTMDQGLTGPIEERNLFSLLGGTYEVQVEERITDLCPQSVCDQGRSSELVPLLGDAVDHWRRGAGDAHGSLVPFPALAGAYEDASEHLDRLDPAAAHGPLLVFDHVMLPHSPWRVTPDGTVYAARDAIGQDFGVWGEAGVAVAHQRHLLQLEATDRLLGRYLDAFRQAGTYDDTLVVVTADHGEAFIPDQPARSLTFENRTEILWTPLLVKEPGQREGRVDDTDVLSIDVVPTVAEILGIDLPWEVDGVPASAAGARDGATKPYHDDARNWLRAGDDEPLVAVEARAGFDAVLAAEPVAGAGPDAAWRRTAHGDLVDRAVEEVGVGAPASAGVAVADLDDWADVDLDGPVPLEVIGESDLPPAAVVAYAVNGTIGAVTEVEGREDDRALVHGLLPPHLLVPGSNDLTAYLVDGPVGDEVLRPLSVTSGPG
jgi:hypothetical protein